MRFFVGKRIRPFGLILGATIGLHDIITASVRPKPKLALRLWGLFLAVWWACCTWWSFASLPDPRDAAIVSVILGAVGMIVYAIGSFFICLINSVVDEAVDKAKRRIRRRALTS
jgi:hypothetical protein